jgi:hypothetical protein
LQARGLDDGQFEANPVGWGTNFSFEIASVATAAAGRSMC